MKSIYGLTKGTELEPMMKAMMQGEANGTMMYYALARMAKEQGLDEVADTFVEAANQEAVHAGFYAVINGKYPQDFWGLVETVCKAEIAGEEKIAKMAEQVRDAGFIQAAEEMEIFAKQEGHHGKMLAEILEKYHPDNTVPAGKKVFVCPVCGFEYVGDISAEADDYVCPLCGQPKSAFQKKNKQ